LFKGVADIVNAAVKVALVFRPLAI